MNRNVFYLLLLVITCLIRFTIFFEITILSILIMIFLNSTIVDHREAADADSVALGEEEKNTEVDEIDLGPKNEDSKGNEYEYKQEYILNQTKVDDKITKLGINDNI